MIYHVCFAADANEPYPPLDAIAVVEADSPLDAVRAAVRAGRVPQDKLYRWARVVIESVDGKPTKALRFPITPMADVLAGWRLSEEWT